MVKKIILLLTLAVLAAQCAFADEEKITGTYGQLNWEISAKGTLTISGKGDINTNSTKAWEKYKKQIKTVVIKDGVQRIGTNAFLGCSYISSVTIPGSVKIIGWEAFEDCTNLSKVVIADGVYDIGAGAFRGCSKLKSLKIPATVMNIGFDLFGIDDFSLQHSRTGFEKYKKLLEICLVVSKGSYAEKYAYDNDYTYNNGKEKIISYKLKAIKKADAVVKKCIKSKMTEKQKAKALHDWIIKNAYYGYNEEESYSLLLTGKGVCLDYSKAYSLLLTRAGIANTIIVGKADYNGEGHAWNLVRINNKWYHVDTTWDDPGLRKRKVSGYERYNYFMKTDKQMRKDHSWDEKEISADKGILPYYYDPRK